MTKGDATTSLQDLKDQVAKFRDDRDWAKHHTPKNLVMSIAIEAAELMEFFQWQDHSKVSKEKLEEELADVLIYCLNLAETLGMDVSNIVIRKIKANDKKYPVKLAKKKYHKYDK